MNVGATATAAGSVLLRKPGMCVLERCLVAAGPAEFLRQRSIVPTLFSTSEMTASITNASATVMEAGRAQERMPGMSAREKRREAADRASFLTTSFIQETPILRW